MAKRTHHQRSKEPPELNITAFLNLMVVLVPFLLITAVFSQITILQLSIPAASTADDSNKKNIKIEVVVRKESLELGDGNRLIRRMPNTEEGYDIRTLSSLLLDIKKGRPQKKDATILLEPDIEYASLVQIMDAVGTAELPKENPDPTAAEQELIERVELFPQISIGDAPKPSGKKRKG